MSLVARNRKRKRHDIRRVLYACAAGLVCASTMVAAHSYVLVRDSLRKEECNEVTLGANTNLFAADGNRLSTIAANQNRKPVSYTAFPQHLIDATIAIEDKRFWAHNGIDYNRILSAGLKDTLSSDGGPRQGGSTITMQLMKNLCHPTDPRNISNKLSEAYSAHNYEKTHQKKYVLERYLNSVFLGHNTVGVEAASLTYFSKNVQDIDLPQAALLAGLPQAPTDYDPFLHPVAAKKRRNLVLGEMARNGYISQAQSEKAQRSGLGLKEGNYFGFKRDGHFVDYIESQLVRMYGRVWVKNKAGKRVQVINADRGRSVVRTGGFRVDTTINRQYQAEGRRVLKRMITDHYGANGPAAALVMIDARTGRLLTMVSTIPYTPKTRFNIAGPQVSKNAGSSFKTFVLTSMIKAGVNPITTKYFSHSPTNIDGGKCASPGVSSHDFKTYSGKGGGQMSIETATLKSDNSVYVQMACDIGPQTIFDTARSMGVTRLTNGIDNYNVAMALGGIYRGTGVLDMARAYAPLANGGYRVNLLAINRIVAPGKKARVFKPVRTRVLQDGVAAAVTDILHKNVLGGTGTRANLPNVPVAGKTGTTDDATDVWFVGYTPRYVTAVWFGYPYAAVPMPGQTGGNIPASIWHEFMSYVTRGQSNQSFPEPTNPVVYDRSFDGYYAGEAARLAAAEAAKAKAEADAKKKAEEDKNKPKPGDKPKPGGTPTPGGGTGGTGGGTGGTGTTTGN